jgi:60S ribosomal subunit assembly/export protein LOC1
MSGKSSGKSSKRASISAKSRPTSSSKSKVKLPPPKQQKTKPLQELANRKKKKNQRAYTDKELGIPQLNKITPVGVQKPRGKKKGKVFIDDRVSWTNASRQTSLMTLLFPGKYDDDSGNGECR